MGQIVGPETLVCKLNKMPGNYPKEENLNFFMSPYVHKGSLSSFPNFTTIQWLHTYLHNQLLSSYPNIHITPQVSNSIFTTNHCLRTHMFTSHHSFPTVSSKQLVVFLPVSSPTLQVFHRTFATHLRLSTHIFKRHRCLPFTTIRWLLTVFSPHSFDFFLSSHHTTCCLLYLHKNLCFPTRTFTPH